MIFISAGHHPARPGACRDHFCEHDEATRWADAIHALLGEDNAMRVPTGVLRDKVAFINARHPALAAEIHFNAIHGDNGSGCLTLYYPGSSKGKLVAGCVQDGMEQMYDRHWDGIMEGYYRMDKSRGPDYFLAKTSCPSIIIEPAFIHQKELITSTRDAACASIAASLLEAKEKLENV